MIMISPSHNFIHIFNPPALQRFRNVSLAPACARSPNLPQHPCAALSSTSRIILLHAVHVQRICERRRRRGLPIAEPDDDLSRAQPARRTASTRRSSWLRCCPHAAVMSFVLSRLVLCEPSGRSTSNWSPFLCALQLISPLTLCGRMGTKRCPAGLSQL